MNGVARGGTMTAIATAVALFGVAYADEAPPAADEAVSTVIVTGTRAEGRTASQSSVPVEVISAERLQQTGYADLGRALEFADPSVNYPRPQTTPSAANTRAVTLRGLSPDEVLVLVNGKRWHSTAMINVNFAVGRGTAPVDLDTIPVAAVERIEVLRDGAAAQYGSDAIAGVVNIILKSGLDGSEASLQGGATGKGDGGNIHGDVSAAFTFAGTGHGQFSASARYQDPTDRADVDQRYGRHTYRIGDPRAINVNTALSAAYPFNDGTELYTDLLVSRKDSSNAVNFRPPGASPLYPDGFLPIVNPLIWDIGHNLGLRFAAPLGFRGELSNSFGSASAQIDLHHSANATLGEDSPTEFDAGGADYRQDVVDLTFGRPLEVLAGGHLSLGGQFRWENYQLSRGEEASTAGAGSQGFPGFAPRIPVEDDRNATAVFADFEVQPLSALTFGAALRYDDYSDFGDKATWKASLRWQALPMLALRASAGTGFRAPSLQQQYYNSVNTVANGDGKSFVNVGTFQVDDPVAQALGATPLRPETSKTWSAGFVLTPWPALSLTADYFRTEIDDRIALSDALKGATVTAILADAGVTDVQQVAFFTNALDTRTEGYEISARYRARFGAATTLSSLLAFERSPTELLRLAGNPTVPDLPLIGQHVQLLLTDAQPTSKLVAQFTLDHGPYTATLAATRFGEYTDVPIHNPQTFGAETIVDLVFSARLGGGLEAGIGVLNVGDTYPDKLNEAELAYAAFGGSYVYGEESPFGVAGRSWYARLHYVW